MLPGAKMFFDGGSPAGNHLVHRWNFSHGLSDEVGNSTATLGADVSLSSDSDGGCAVISSTSHSTGWINLGAGVTASENDALTIEMWFKPTTFVEEWTQLFSVYNGRPGGTQSSRKLAALRARLDFTFQYESARDLDISRSNSSVSQVRTGMLTHLVAVLHKNADTTHTVYFAYRDNGGLYSTGLSRNVASGYARVVLDGQVQNYIGICNEWNNMSFLGNVYDVRIYDVALTESEIEQSYALGHSSVLSGVTGVADGSDGYVIL